MKLDNADNEFEDLKAVFAEALGRLIQDGKPIVESALLRLGCTQPAAADWAKSVGDSLAKATPAWAGDLADSLRRNNGGHKLYIHSPRRQRLQALRQAFTDGLAAGETLPALCKRLGVPKSTGHNWRRRQRQGGE